MRNCSKRKPQMIPILFESKREMWKCRKLMKGEGKYCRKITNWKSAMRSNDKDVSQGNSSKFKTERKKRMREREREERDRAKGEESESGEQVQRGFRSGCCIRTKFICTYITYTYTCIRNKCIRYLKGFGAVMASYKRVIDVAEVLR